MVLFGACGDRRTPFVDATLSAGFRLHVGDPGRHAATLNAHYPECEPAGWGRRGGPVDVVAPGYARGVVALAVPPVSPRDDGGQVFYEWESHKKRPGRRFEPVAERELDGALRHLATRLPGAASGVLAITEMPSPSGIPDLVVVTRAIDNTKARWRLDAPPLLVPEDARIVAACSPVAALSTLRLRNRLQIDDETLRRRLNRLQRHSYVYRTERGWLRNEAMKPIGRVFALEAKVDDWRKALGQALLYGSWSDGSGIVLLQMPREHSHIIREFRRLGVGLAHERRWVVRPRVHRLDPWRRLLASEHVVAAIRPSPGMRLP
jgi:hypothetical protein